MQYKQTGRDGVTRVTDGAFIPNDPANRDYQKFLAWQAVGNEPEPTTEPIQAPRRLVRKSVVLARLTDPQLDQAMSLMTVRQKEQWRSPDRPEVYCDDPETLALIVAVGADPTVVMAE